MYDNSPTISSPYYVTNTVITIRPSQTTNNFNVVRQLEERARRVARIAEEFKKLTRRFRQRCHPGLFASILPAPSRPKPVPRAPILLLRARGQAPRKAR